MGHTRDDRQAPGLGTSDPSTAYVGRRRASISAPESGTPATPYVGRRRAATPTLELPATIQVAPAPTSVPTARGLLKSCSFSAGRAAQTPKPVWPFMHIATMSR